MKTHLLAGRHPATQGLARWFAFDHLTHPHARAVSEECHDLAESMIGWLRDGPELSTGLRRLLEAKDCFVRQALADDYDAPPPGEVTA